jgi:CheY-like chemotaxis protein
MTDTCSLSLLGLPSTDRALLETLFTQSWGRGTSYRVVPDVTLADMVIANADDPDVLLSLREAQLAAPVLLIGSTDGGTGWVRLPRPLHLPAVIDAVNHLNPHSKGHLSTYAGPGRAGWPAAAAGATASQTAAQPLLTSPGQNLPAATPQGAAPAFADSGRFADFKSTQILRPTDFGETRPFAPSVLPAFWDLGKAPPVVSAPAIAHELGLGLPGELPRPMPRPAEVRATPTPTQPLGSDGLMWHDDLVLPTPSMRGDLQPLPSEPAPPAQPMPAAPAAHSVGVSAPAPVAPALSRESILLVGAAKLADGGLMRALLKFGYQVDCVLDEAAARERLAQRVHRFVFLDAASLGRSTNAVCRALRRHGRELRHLPHLVVVSKQDQLLRRWLAKLAGCDAWMVMPLRKSELRSYLLSRGLRDSGVSD